MSGYQTNPSAAAIAAAGGEVATNKSTDGTFTANSDTLYPSQKAVKTFVTALVTGLLDLKGSTDCSGNPNYPAASKGDCYVVSVAGKIGGASGITVGVGDFYFALADNAGGTQASVGTSWDVLEFNLVGALLAANNLSDVANAGTALTNLGISAFIKTLLDDADAAAARTTLGVTPGITNSAGNGVIPVSDGTNLLNSPITYDGSNVGVAVVGATLIQAETISMQGATSAGFFSSTTAAFYSAGGEAILGDFQGDGFNTKIIVKDADQSIKMTNLPTSDPHVVDQVWNNLNMIVRSNG